MSKMLRLSSLFIIVIMISASCQFSEECDYRGNIELRMDWESLWGKLQKPDSLTVLFYRDGTSPVRRVLLGDTIYESIPSGETDLITFNQPTETECKDIEITANAELQLPTYFQGNIRAVKECPMICAYNKRLVIPIEGTAKETLTPLPVVKQVEVTVNVVKEGSTGNVRACQASLSGISTGYSLGKQEAVRNKATCFFSLDKVDKKEDSYFHDFFVLGVNPSKQDQEAIPKKLSVTVIFDDGESRDADIDLTAQFDGFTENIFRCEVTVTITSLSTNMEIASWEQGVWDTITIQ